MRIDQHLSKKGQCVGCQKHSFHYFLDHDALPIWKDDDVTMYHLPRQLQDLSHAEKMLIQRISPFVPLHHIKNGTFGLSGHVVSFEQDIGKFYKHLPRQQNDTGVLKVLQAVRTEIGGQSKRSITKAFRVRKAKVFGALEWLKQKNHLYSDIEIDYTALDWIDGTEGILNGTNIFVETMETSIDDHKENADMGPAPSQCMDPSTTGNNVKAFGYAEEGGKTAVTGEDQIINDALQHAVNDCEDMKDGTVNWPDISDVPVNEHSDKRIFALAFPWLFPGGVGDVKDYPGDLGDWGKQMLFYEDARFTRDKMFCFFALNYIVRRRNQSGGNWFVDSFTHNKPDTLKELQEKIKEGDTSFVSSLTYHNRRIKGSNPYWMTKRSEAYTWVNHHVHQGHGAPTFFITLSCAEYFWADVIDLLRDRLELAGIDPSGCTVGSPKLIQIANDYSVVIQEYFQKRVEIWLETVGKEVFNIEHYWVRYEFAPGRGQIHAHFLAIAKNQDIFKHCYSELKKENGEQKRAEALSEWAKQRYGLTAEVGPDFDNRHVDSTNTPVQFRFKDIRVDTSSEYNDAQDLLKAVQVHGCSNFCMKTSQSKNKDRCCKAGCGSETAKGKCDTPGFPLSASPEIKTDHRHAQKLYMPRNHKRINQTSMDLLQSWRGNCDVQLLVYNCDPKNPDVGEIARVTDYVVAYSCKGNCTYKEEREHSKSLIIE